MPKKKGKGVILKAKPPGRPSALSIHVSPGERSPIDGKFGQAKTAYGLDRIKARLKETSESWIAGIFMVLNLVKPAGVVLLCLLLNMETSLTAWLRAIIYGKQTMPAYHKSSESVQWAVLEFNSRP
jgi:hypothetical protein